LGRHAWRGGVKSQKVDVVIEGMLREQPGVHLIEEISDIGFNATLIPPTRADMVTLRIYGMMCSSCTSTIGSGLQAMPGVTNIAVSLVTETAKIEFDNFNCSTGAVARMGQKFNALTESFGDTTVLVYIPLSHPNYPLIAMPSATSC